MNNEPFWEKLYQDVKVDTFGRPCHEICDLVPSLPEHAKVLDLGCGDGRNSIYLAKKGFEVTAIDISEKGINKLNYLSKNNNLPIKTAVQDAKDFKFKENFHLIIAYGLLHFMTKEDRENLITQAKKHTFEEGFHVLSVFTNAIPVDASVKHLFLGLFNEGELFEYYHDWDFNLRSSVFIRESHHGGPKHTHAVNNLVAQNLSPIK